MHVMQGDHNGRNGKLEHLVTHTIIKVLTNFRGLGLEAGGILACIIKIFKR